ncbi:MAG: homoserine O-succinyltransferase, partial [Clostridiales Family XIII bacterium]|nr:homoserine O-succinyltransferase [Clostridiales Family XIII bacterium]
GVFRHEVINQSSLLTKGIDKFLYIPHSRWTGFNDKDIEESEKLHILIRSNKAGIHLIHAYSGRQIFMQGHWEYDIDTLKKEYERDIKKNAEANIPDNYFKDDNPKAKIIANWRGNGTLFFLNWINFVYQKTPFDLEKLKEI